jgi:5'-nucleotidase
MYFYELTNVTKSPMIFTRFTKMHRVVVVLAFAKAILLTTSCKTNDYQLKTVQGTKTEIDSTLQDVAAITTFIAPYKAQVDAQMNEPLSYNPKAMNKNDFAYNTPIGNLLAGMMREQATGVYKRRTGKDIDIVLMNHGGIRAGLPAGNITMRNAFEVMPFENEMMVASLTGNQVQEMVAYLTASSRAHPIDGLQLSLNKDKSLRSALVLGKPINPSGAYEVLTSDYLYGGGDSMTFFAGAPVTVLDYKIRNAMIDYLRKTDTLKATQDDRYRIEN